MWSKAIPTKTKNQQQAAQQKENNQTKNPGLFINREPKQSKSYNKISDPSTRTEASACKVKTSVRLI
jgi:hypothetical protein